MPFGTLGGARVGPQTGFKRASVEADDEFGLARRVKRLEAPGAPLRKALDIIARRCCTADEHAFVLREVLSVLEGAWDLPNVGDSYVPICHLHAATVEVLAEALKFNVTNAVVYPNLDWLPAVAAIGATICGLRRVGSQTQLPDEMRFQIGAADAAGFGWEENSSTVPVFQRLLGSLPPVAVLWNAMSTHAGVPTLSQTTNCSALVTNFRFGKGVAVLCRRSEYPCPRKAADYVSDTTCILAAMLNPEGPYVLAAFAAEPLCGEEQFAISDFLAQIWTAEVASVLLLAGPGSASLVGPLQSAGWQPADGCMGEVERAAQPVWSRGCTFCSVVNDVAMGVGYAIIDGSFVCAADPS